MSDREALLSNDNSRMSYYSDYASMSDVRIILMGKTGTGKSSSGNTILGQKVFHVEASPEQVTSTSSKRSARQGGRVISVIDTPGFCGSLTKEEMKTQINECVDLSVPGPHVFLLVINLSAIYTPEEVNTVKLIQENFGEDAIRHTIVLFTHADQLTRKTLQQYVGESQHLRKLINSCSGRYHVFNNEDMMNRTQWYVAYSSGLWGRDRLCRVRVKTESLKGRVRVKTESLKGRVRVKTESLKGRVRVKTESLKGRVRVKTESLKERVRVESEKAEIGLETGLEYYITTSRNREHFPLILMYSLHHKKNGVYVNISLSAYTEVYRSLPDPGRIQIR
ncbi:unnamed protein product [Leuciscus chuanchicus]